MKKKYLWLLVVLSTVALAVGHLNYQNSALQKLAPEVSVRHKYDPNGPPLVIHIDFPQSELGTTLVSQDNRVLFKCGARKRGPTFGLSSGHAHTRAEIYQALGPPQKESENEAVWTYPNITDLNAQWKPHAVMEHLVVYFGEGDIAVDVETDFQRIRELGEPLTPSGETRSQ